VTGKKRVAVVGVGTMGSQAAWRLAARGAEVVGFDRFAPGHDRSAAGGETRIFRSAQFEDARYVPLLRHADTLWRELQLETGRELRKLTGCLLMGAADHQQMRTALESVSEHELDHEVFDGPALAKRFPQFRLDDGDVALFDRHAGFVRPELTIHAATRRAEELGARVHRYSTVKEIESRGRGVRVRTDTGAEDVDSVVVTAGPWINEILPDLGFQVDIKRLINAWFVATKDDWFRDSPSFIRTAPTHCYGVPSPDGISVKLGLSAARHRPVDDPNELDRTVRPAELEIFTELIAAHLPELHPDPVRLSVFMEGYTPSSRPLVGHIPGEANIVVLGGFSGHGFKLSPAMGDIAADLALDGETGLPLDFLSLSGRTES
jgi:sarcosine oxidase